jgi:pimeloyl-ACP methyl ester carboxylesterase
MKIAGDTSPIAQLYDEQLRISYLRAGESGPAIVLLHGWGAFKELWWSTLHALAPAYRAYALDMPGHGGSALGQVSTIAELAEVIAGFCAAHGLEQITLVGHSMGGNIVVELALRHPGLAGRLVLVDAAVDAHELPAYIRSYLADSYGWAALRLSLALGSAFRPLGRQVPHLHGGGWLRPWLRRSSYLAATEPTGLRRLLSALISNVTGERLARVLIPTLVISGQLDALVPIGHSRKIARSIPGARFVVIPGALHNPMDERPRAFERVLLEFLRET